MEPQRNKSKAPAGSSPSSTLSASDRAKHQKTFVGLDRLKADLRGFSPHPLNFINDINLGKEGAGFGCLKKFEEWAEKGEWQLFSPDISHYDWWCFPVSDVR